MLVPGQVEIGPADAGQIRVNVGLAGVGPTDLAIRSGRLKGAFGAQPGSVLGFEASGVVAAAGPDAGDVQPGDAVAVFLPGLGGYAEQVLARYWVKVPGPVSPQDAAALPASGEAAARVVDEVGVAPDETVLIAGAAGAFSAPTASGFGVRLSEPDGPRAAERLQTVMDLLAAGRLTLRSQTVIPLADAAGAHRALESHQLRAKALLSVPA